MHNLDDKHQTRLGFGPTTSEFRATTEQNEPPGPALMGYRLSLQSVLVHEEEELWNVGTIMAN